MNIHSGDRHLASAGHLDTLYKRVRALLVFFIVALALSGLTALPLEWEVDLLNRIVSSSPLVTLWPAMVAWIAHVNEGLQYMYRHYPFIAYGTDWLAFAHIVIAVAFWGPLRDPVKNIWVIEFGMVACMLVIPLALICGPLRGIPFYWRLFDCAFGVFGIIPLWLCRKFVLQIARLEQFAPRNS